MKIGPRQIRRTVRRVPPLLLAGFCGLFLGCREELGRFQPPSARLQGRIAFRGEPIGGGWVEFHPIDGALGDIRCAPLDLDGRFETDRVALGRNAIRVAHPKLVPRSLRAIGRIPVTVRTIKGPRSTVEIDLARDLRGSRRAD